MLLQTGHFGIKDPLYLFALQDFLLGYSNEQSAKRITHHTGFKISRTMIRDNFRVVLYNQIRQFGGNKERISFNKYCANHFMPSCFNGKNSVQMSFCVARYLLDVFDLHEPLTTEYFDIQQSRSTKMPGKIKK